METLKEAKEYLKSNIGEGTKCPCCGQFVKLYTRKLNSSMAYALILIYKSPFQGFFHVEDYLKSINCPSSIRGDFAKLRWWNLIEQFKGEREDGSKRVGHYRITTLGKNFTRGFCTVKESIRLYNQGFYGFSGNEIDIKRALKNKFNYNELMGT